MLKFDIINTVDAYCTMQHSLHMLALYGYPDTLNRKALIKACQGKQLPAKTLSALIKAREAKSNN